MTIEQLKKLKETEDKVEFKEAKGGNFSYNGGNRAVPKERRRCILGYVTAFANEGGGYLVLGMHDKHPHKVVGTTQCADAVGKLEQEIYRDIKIRVNAFELFDENGLRVLVIEIPGRPIGKVYKFEDVPLMRVGEELLPMSDDYYRKIINETEPDFSATICKHLSIADLDVQAIDILKNKYASKKQNPSFRSLSTEQVLSDLNLMIGAKLTYAALILLGSPKPISKYLPQASVIIEYRKSLTQISYDARIEYCESLFTAIDKIWVYLNQPLSNPNEHFQQGPYIIDIQRFNEEVVREAILNAIAHRDYHLSSSVVLKLFPEKLIVLNPGGFPLGVTKENILSVSSMPRNRLLAETLEKTGLVERSSQGVDKMFKIMLSESKPEPDFTNTDDFQVELDLLGNIRDINFAFFINEEQKLRDKDNQLGVFDIIALDKVRQGLTADKLQPAILEKLINEKLIGHIGSPASGRLILSEKYYEISRQLSTVRGYKQQELQAIISCFDNFSEIKMGAFVDVFKNTLSRPKVKYLVDKLCKDGVLLQSGKGAGVTYNLASSFAKATDKVSAVIDYLKSLT